jgi:hypothetical protein
LLGRRLRIALPSVVERDGIAGWVGGLEMAF